jgi:hypothetical protein
MNAPLDSRRPTFARDFPRALELDVLVDAFAKGDYASVRAMAPALASASDPAIAKAARALLDRTKPDRGVIALMGLTAALLVVVATYWIAHGHP